VETYKFFGFGDFFGGISWRVCNFWYESENMGRQGGIARFLGSCAHIVGYVDDGKVLWRKPSSLTRKKWLKMPTMEKQRVAARQFGGASMVAGNLWSRLPSGMRKLADGGAFNRLVGQCRMLMVEDPDEAGGGLQVWDVDGLRGLDLSVDSAAGMSGLKVRRDAEGWRLDGVRDLMNSLDEALGYSAGKPSEKYVVASKLHDLWETKEWVDFEKLGSCDGWKAPKRSEKLEIRNLKFVQGKPYVERRVRVWIHAVEIVDTEWCPREKKYLRKEFSQRTVSSKGVSERFAGARGWHNGFCSAWEQNEHHDGWAGSYRLSVGGLDLLAPSEYGTGVYVVFSAVEVSEKRGRHWVRLPWCSSMTVDSIAEGDLDERMVLMQARDPSLRSGHGLSGDKGIRLVAIPDRVLERICCRDLDCFEDWARHSMGCWDRFLLGMGLEVKSGVWNDKILKKVRCTEPERSDKALGLLGIARSLFSKAFAMAEDNRAGP
jgi:hypothetical protein